MVTIKQETAACAARVTVLGPFLCHHVFCHYAQGDNKRVIPIGLALHWLDFKFRKSTAFKSYGVKS